ncbi:MAG: PLP-dependent aminotransferase family protein [Gammaproteobacteria bacterium]|nr:PLP-dependent aminotransferase family protein [Gammaproteobacteria bacterium]
MLYLDVADQIKQRILAGHYLPGDRLPSLRTLSDQLKVSIATVQQAYRRLENDGILEPRPQSGFYVKPQAMPPTAAPRTTMALPSPSIVNTGELAMRILHATRMPGMIQLGAAVPDTYFLPTHSLQRGLRQLLKPNNAQHWHHYEFPPGNDALRRQIARRSDSAGFNPTPEDILITNGCQEALILSLRAIARPGDIIAVESPTFYGILQAIESLQMKVLEIPAHPHSGISVEALAMALEQWPIKACVITPSFNNPLGACMDEGAKRAVAHLLAQHDVPLIEDDIYGELAHHGPRPSAIKAYDRKGNVVYCSSFSKTISPGLRVGWVSGGRFHEKIVYLKYLANFATATPNQQLLAEFLTRQGYDRYLREIRNTYAKQIARLSQAIVQFFPLGTKITQPVGGFILWIEMPRECDALKLYYIAAEHQIAIAPGPLFSAKRKYRHHIRLNAAIPWTPAVESAIAQLGQLAKGLQKGTHHR